MSYDLQVYTPADVDGVRLRRLVSGVASLDVEEHDEARGWYTVVRGKARGYCLTIDGPVPVEPEDVPDEVTAVLLGATHVLSVSVEGSSSADVPYAVRCARHLAQALGGAALDQQSGEVWSRGASRRAAKPVRDERVSVIDLNWYVHSGSVADDFAERYLSLCRRYLPEALPRRFGDFEPLQGKLAEAGDEGFAQAWRAVTSTLFFSASAPCIGGSMWAGPGERRPRPVWRMGLEVHWQPFAEDHRWRTALRLLFLGFAQEAPAFYASAEVLRDNIWSGRSMWADGATERPIVPARGVHGWMGLPPYPTWWAWYGDPYRSLVQGRTPVGEVTEHDGGIFHELHQSPLGRDDLLHSATRGPDHRRVADWVAPELLAVVQPADRRAQPTQLAPAATIPSSLR